MLVDSQTQTDDRYHFLFVLYLIVVALAPWPLGSNRDWAWPILSLSCCLLAVISLAVTPTRINSLALTIYCALAASILWMAFQLYGIPPIVSPLTLDPYSSRAEMLKVIGYASFVFVTLQLVVNRQRVEIVISTVVIVGLLQALAGSIQVLVMDQPRASGSFVNANHYAGYLQMAISLGIGLMIANQAASRSDRPWVDDLIELVTGPKLRLRIMIMIMVIGLILSRSRLGNVGFLAGIIIASVAVFIVARTFSRKTVFFLASILVLDALLLGNHFGLERLGERLQRTPEDFVGRASIYILNQEIVWENLWAGTGAGSYEIVFPQFRGPGVGARVTHGHNDYQEFLIELGMIGVLPLLIVVGTGLYAQFTSCSRRSDRFSYGIALGCLIGTISLLIHGFGDFNLQIPSNSLLFLLLLTLPIANRVKAQPLTG